MNKPILCLDFDGVLHSYKSGWQGADVISDPPVPGAVEFVREAKKYFDVQVFSSRSCQDGGLYAMQDWMQQHGFPPGILFPDHKPPAFLTIDDRGYRFEGIFPDPKTLLELQPWFKDDPIGG